jgi:Cytochrome C biogenesis protein transmembrane region
MAGTIIPMVHRDRQSGKGPTALWLHTLGNLIGAGAMGGLLGLVGTLLPWQSMPMSRGFAVAFITGTVSLIYSTRELGLLRIPAAQCRRQVPQRWRVLMPHEVSSTLYGMGLGFGLGTRIAVSTFYPAALWAILIADPFVGAIGMAAFGLGRALPLHAIVGISKTSEDRVRLTEALHHYKPLMHFVNGLALSSAGSCLILTGLMLR